MKLAQALIERSDIQKRLSQLRERLAANARVQEGEKPAEDPKHLLDEASILFSRLEELIVAINHTNDTAVVNGQTLSTLLAKRDVLTLKVNMMRDFLLESSNLASRYGNTEIKVLSTVPVREIRKEVDELSQQLRELDTVIQESNWLTELL